MKNDLELRRLIRRWSPPPASNGLDERMMLRYRRGRGWRTWWNRFRNARLSVPLPWVAGFLFACLAILLYLRNVDDPSGRLAGFVPVSAPQITVSSTEGMQ